MRRTRTPVLLAAAGVLALTALSACGSDDGDSAAPAATSPASTAASGTPSATPAATTQKVVDLSGLVFELAELGVPVAGGIYSADFSKPTLDGIAGVDATVAATSLAAPVVTANFKVDVEELAKVKPDVIVIDESYKQYYGATLAQAEKIAPVKTIPSGTWQETTLALAQAVGVPDAGKARVAAGEKALSDLKASVAAAGKAGSTVSLLRYFNEPLAFVPPSLPSQVLDVAGLEQPAAQGDGVVNDGGLPDAQAQKKLSLEVLGSHDADTLVFAYSSDKSKELKDFLAFPTVARLGAVKAGKVGAVPYFLWALNSAVGVERITADLQAIVVEGKTTGA